MRILTTQIGFVKEPSQCGSGKGHSGCLGTTVEMVGYHLLFTVIGEGVERAGG